MAAVETGTGVVVMRGGLVILQALLGLEVTFEPGNAVHQVLSRQVVASPVRFPEPVVVADDEVLGVDQLFGPWIAPDHVFGFPRPLILG